MFTSILAQAAIRDVPGQYATVTAAVNAAVNGDTIRVASGTHYGSFTTSKHLIIEGQGPEVTILHANWASYYAKVIHSYVSYPVGYYDPGSLTIKNCTITGAAGSALSVSDSILILENCVIRNNGGSAYYCGGGAIYGSHSPNVEIKNCIIRNNTHPAMAGAIYCSYEDRFSISICQDGFKMFNTLVYDNSTSDYGPHIIYIKQSDNAARPSNGGKVSHCTITQNTDTSWIDPILTVDGSNPWLFTVMNSQIVGNIPEPQIGYMTLQYCLVESSYYGGTNIVSSSPGYRNAGLHDFRLLPDSICINAGILDGDNDDDFDGFSRTALSPGSSNIGPYETCDYTVQVGGVDRTLRGCLVP